MFHCPSYFLWYLPILSINFNHLYQSTIYSKFILNSYRKKSSNIFNINFQLVDINWHSNPLYNKKNNKCNERRIIERWYDLLAMEDGGWPRSVVSRIISFAAREDIVAALVKAGKIERRPLAVARGKLLFLSVHLWVPPHKETPFFLPPPSPLFFFFAHETRSRLVRERKPAKSWIDSRLSRRLLLLWRPSCDRHRSHYITSHFTESSLHT